MTAIREYTNKIADMVDEGLILQDELLNMLLAWMSEDDAREFYMANIAPELPDEDEED